MCVCRRWDLEEGLEERGEFRGRVQWWQWGVDRRLEVGVLELWAVLSYGESGEGEAREER